MAELVIHSGRHRGKRLRLPQREIVIGRDESCAIRLPSADVSRRHCALRPAPDGLLVRDLDSRNGTFINDGPVLTETLLGHGDFLRVGPLVMEVRLHAGRSAPADTDSAAASDDEIADWLTESAEADSTSPSDTTVTLPTVSSAEPPEAESEPPKRRKSVAEEAAEIIRRHHEQMCHEREQAEES